MAVILTPENIEALDELARKGALRKWTGMELVHVHQGLEKLLREYKRLNALINTPRDRRLCHGDPS